MTAFRLLFVAALIAAPARAALVEMTGTPVRNIEASGQSIPIYPEVKLLVPGTPAKLQLTGAGIRKKTVVLIKVNVYVAASYAEDAKTVRETTDVLGAMRKGKARALRLTFLRDLSAEQVRGAFADALEKNGVDPKAEPIAGLLAKIDKPFPEKSTMTVVGVTAPEKPLERIEIEFPGGQASMQGKDLVHNFWKIWFGEPADGGLEALKPQLLGKPE